MDKTICEKINFKFEGKSNPTSDELIEVLRSIRDIVPKESRDTFYINKIEEGSIDITAIVEPMMDLFFNSDFNTYWNVIEKVMIAATLVRAPIRLVNWVRSKTNKANITMSEVKELMDMLNDDPNSLRIIKQDDFKNFKKISKIIQKRKSGLTIVRGSNNQTFNLKEEDTRIIDLVANAKGDETLVDIENRLLHLNISRVSFVGKEQWRVKILEEGDNGIKFISIEDNNLLSSIGRNEIYFSGKEVIEAMVRIETSSGNSKYYLTEFRNIVNIKNIHYK